MTTMPMLNDIELSDQELDRNKRRYDVFIPQYLTKYIHQNETVCSAGCGTGYDVEVLCNLGYDVYGFDPGVRTNDWKARHPAVSQRLKMGFAQDLPFGPDRFDVVYALEVIEHVGTEDGQWKLLPDHFEIRRQFLESCLDMLKPGGRMLISTSHRLCPLDPGHGHHYTWLTQFVMRETGITLTVPWHKKNFVLSRSDVVKLVAATRYRDRYSIKRLPVRNYLAHSRFGTNHPFLKRCIDGYMTVASFPVLIASPLNPVLVLEIRKS
jgi:2-polyprenyl-3-methyl-5-hydroxy-6-metoxy-1,4-benzoquinol methylase